MEPYRQPELSPLHREQLDDVPALIQAVVEHRGHPDALGAAVGLVDALELMAAVGPPEDRRSWASCAEAAREAARRVVAARLGEGGWPVPGVATEQVRAPRGGRCPKTWRPPDCGGQRRRRRRS